MMLTPWTIKSHQSRLCRCQGRHIFGGMNGMSHMSWVKCPKQNMSTMALQHDKSRAIIHDSGGDGKLWLVHDAILQIEIPKKMKTLSSNSSSKSLLWSQAL